MSKKPKYYFESSDSEMCFDLEYHLDNARCNSLNEIELYEANPDNDNYHFYCTSFGECGIKGDCGRHCRDYEPRNKKSGICKHKSKCYTHGDKVVFKVPYT